MNHHNKVPLIPNSIFTNSNFIYAMTEIKPIRLVLKDASVLNPPDDTPLSARFSKLAAAVNSAYRERFGAGGNLGANDAIALVAAVSEFIEVSERLDFEYSADSVLPLEDAGEAADEALRASTELDSWLDRFDLTAHRSELHAVILGIGIWAMRHELPIQTTEAIVNALATRSNEAQSKQETAAAYALMVWSEAFPATERVSAGVSNRDMIQETFRPLFLLLFGCMWLTAATELGPDQWVGSLITNLVGMQGILILVYTAGIMFVMRFFGGRLAHAMSPTGLLTVSAILSSIGLFSLGSASTPTQAFLAATIFGVGKTYFWPVMLGVTAERFPKGGALALAVIGGTGNLSVAFILPIMGGWYDDLGAAAAFRYVGILPIVLAVVFGALYFYDKSRGGYKAEELKAVSAGN